ncbi:MAG: adenosine deaminase [Planctomycetota bacterium]|jgi:adenosine deaminase
MTSASRQPDSFSEEASALAAFPKVDLHCHVDGAARTATLLELAREADIALPADTPEALAEHVRAGPGCRSLADFLDVFETFYPALSHPGAMGRLAHELVQDAWADGVLHLEARFCPALQADDAGYGVEDVLRETLAGLETGARETGISVGAIVCCYRILSPAQNADLVELAVRHADRGVVGIDLAGPEDRAGAPLAALFTRAKDAGLGITVHAGEAAGPASVAEALDVLHATRLGHGVALAEDAALAARVADAGVALECCLTSNLRTGAVAEIAEHPFDSLRRAGLAVTLNTDDPSVCDTTLAREFALAQRTWGYDAGELAALTRAAVDAAFLDDAARAALHARVEAELAD